MARVEIVNSLAREIKKKFKSESHKIVNLLYTLEESPNKGKLLGNVNREPSLRCNSVGFGVNSDVTAS